MEMIDVYIRTYTLQIFDTHIANGVEKGDVISFTWLPQGLLTEINGKVGREVDK